jgi:hypothetical protein
VKELQMSGLIPLSLVGPLVYRLIIAVAVVFCVGGMAWPLFSGQRSQNANALPDDVKQSSAGELQSTSADA